MRRTALLVLAAAACSDSDDSEKTVTLTPPPAPTTVVAPVDASMADGTTELPDTDPSMHLDEDDGDDGRDSEPLGPRARSRRLLEILLRSTPPGATAVVDGKVIGVTPTYWEGEFTGRARDFTFVLPGHALARYKFVPIQSGIVHARLTPVLSLPGTTPPLPTVPPLPDRGAAPAPKPKVNPTPPPEVDAPPAPDAEEPADAAPGDDAGP